MAASLAQPPAVASLADGPERTEAHTVTEARILRRGRVLGLWAAAGAVAVVLAVALAGAAPTAPLPGLPDPGPLPGWALPVLRLLGHAAALTVVGAGLSTLLSARPLPRRSAAAGAAAWAVTSLAALLLGLSEVVALPVTDVLRGDLLRFYVVEVPQGRALLLTAAGAGAVALVASRVRGRTGAVVVLTGALLALTPPLLTGHAAGSQDHRLVQAALVVHVMAAVLWVGGLAALALLRTTADLAPAARRFSPLALGCAVAVVLSGLVGAWLRLDQPSQLWTTGYGALLLVKAIATALLLLAGAAHRRRTLRSLAAGDRTPFARLAVGEVALMAATFGIAVALSRTPLG